MLASRAIVIGSGIAGLSAAAAVNEYFEEVVIFERDRVTLEPRPRPGAPQGRQPHLLLCGGAAAFQQLFPGFDADVIAAGGIAYSPSRDLRSEIPDLPVLPRRDLGFRSLAARRPLLESVLARRAIARPGVTLRSGARVLRIATTADGTRVTGVESVDREGNVGFEPADLVIDASGTGTPTIACLKQSGRASPVTETVGVDIGYSSTVYALPGYEPDFIGLVTYPAAGSSRTGYMIRVSQDEWHIVLVGRGNDQPPADIGSYLDFAASLSTPTIANALQNATASEPIARFRFPANVRRRFAGPSEPPAGLLPIGDGLCRFNPVYGQGMTVAAQEALLLRNLLSRASTRDDWQHALTQPYLNGCEALVDRAWSFSVIPDFAYAETTGTPPADLQERLARHGEMLRQAVDDAEVHHAFLEALHLVERPDTAEFAARVAARRLQAPGDALAVARR